jgi:hypothetical protein
MTFPTLPVGPAGSANPTGLRNTAWIQGAVAPPQASFSLYGSRVSLPPGTVLAGRYRIEQPLGAGAFAVVFAAWDLSLHRWVAVKAYDAATGGQVSADEVRLQATCQHPNLMPLHDAGSDPLHGVVFLVFPLYPGTDLAAALNRMGPMPFRAALHVAEQVCGALDFLAQRRGIVHGDIKPSNIWLTPSGAALLMDFNLPGLLSRSGNASNSAGTPGFVAPEALQGCRDPRSDIFSLGCVLYQCLAGAPPFADHQAVWVGRPTPIRRLRPEIRPALEAVVHRAIASNPAERFQSAREFQTALRYPAFCAGLGIPRFGGLLRLAGQAAQGVLWATGAALRGAWRVAEGTLELLLRWGNHLLHRPRQALIEAAVAVILAGYAIPQAGFWLQAHRRVLLLSGPGLLLVLILLGKRRHRGGRRGSRTHR